MLPSESNRAAHVETTDSAWKSLYRVGGAAALIATVFFLSDIIVLPALGSLPTTATAWFTLLQNNRVIGLAQLFFSDLIGIVLMFPIVFALAAAMRRENAAYAAFAAVLAFAGIAIVLATNTNYSMIYLSNQYAAATSEVQKSLLLAAGESLLAAANSTGFYMGGLLIESAFVMISVVMLQSRLPIFSRRIAYLGILAHGLDLAHSIVLLILIPIFNSDIASAIGIPLLAIGGTLQLVWYPLIGRSLLQLGRRISKEEMNRS
jgi:hypothetical protein